MPTYIPETTRWIKSQDPEDEAYFAIYGDRVYGYGDDATCWAGVKIDKSYPDDTSSILEMRWTMYDVRGYHYYQQPSFGSRGYMGINGSPNPQGTPYIGVQYWDDPTPGIDVPMFQIVGVAGTAQTLILQTEFRLVLDLSDLSWTVYYTEPGGNEQTLGGSTLGVRPDRWFFGAYLKNAYSYEERYDFRSISIITTNELDDFLYIGTMEDMSCPTDKMDMISPFNGHTGVYNFWDALYDPWPIEGIWYSPDAEVESISQIGGVGRLQAASYLSEDVNLHTGLVFCSEGGWLKFRTGNTYFYYELGNGNTQFRFVTCDSRVWTLDFYHIEPTDEKIIKFTSDLGVETTVDVSAHIDYFTQVWDFTIILTSTTIELISDESGLSMMSAEFLAPSNYKIDLYSPARDGYVTYLKLSICYWYTRCAPGPLHGKNSMECFPFNADRMDATIDQWLKKVYQFFLEKIIDPANIYDNDTLKGVKITNVDGQNNDFELNTICFVLDKYNRLYTYALRENPAIPESLPDIVVSSRSITGHYWELIHVGFSSDAVKRLYSEQLTLYVSDTEPGLYSYSPSADSSKVMIQINHLEHINPEYLRAFKVPGENTVRVESSLVGQQLVNVSVNFMLIDT